MGCCNSQWSSAGCSPLASGAVQNRRLAVVEVGIAAFVGYKRPGGMAAVEGIPLAAGMPAEVGIPLSAASLVVVGGKPGAVGGMAASLGVRTVWGPAVGGIHPFVASPEALEGTVASECQLPAVQSSGIVEGVAA